MTVTVTPVLGLPEVEPGADLAALIVESIRSAGLIVEPGDVLVITSKIVSKAEGAMVSVPDEGADSHRAVVEKQAVSVLRRRDRLVIAETRHGLVCANAGVDRSNVPLGWVVLLPADPDRSAHSLRIRLERALGMEMAVLITDTFGRPWRRGLTDVAIGVSGMLPITDLRGTIDSFGRALEVTEIAIADEIAAAADLVMGKTNGVPVAIVRGVDYKRGQGRGTDLIRPAGEDLFR